MKYIDGGLEMLIVVHLFVVLVVGCGQGSQESASGPDSASREYVEQVARIIGETISQDALRGLELQDVTRQYVRFAADVKSVPTVGVSDKLALSAHRWADSYVNHAQAIDDAMAIPGENAAVADGIARLMLGESPATVYGRESLRQMETNQAWRRIQSTYDLVQLRKSDFVRESKNVYQ